MHFCSYFHGCDLVFIGLWHGGHPPRIGRDRVSQEQPELLEAEWAYSRYEQLNMIDEKCMTAMCHGQLYQRRIE